MSIQLFVLACLLGFKLALRGSYVGLYLLACFPDTMRMLARQFIGIVLYR